LFLSTRRVRVCVFVGSLDMIVFVRAVRSKSHMAVPRHKKRTIWGKRDATVCAVPKRSKGIAAPDLGGGALVKRFLS